ncbi:MAG: recN [Rickettsiaceae bacterium]|jgi:DNA repair protein RecN (Recombination protein N)|nr:recN [Rickettsiaceae bacterium]
MLTNLFISNIVLIDKLEVSLTDGFCVLTGETGAGKSILLDALGLALGGRASSGLLRAGQSQGSVTATFNVKNNKHLIALLEEQGVEVDDEVFLRRVIYQDGKTKSFINDMPVGVNLLGDAAEQLIEIHGQHDQRGLLSSKMHRSVIDQYGRLDSLLSDTKGKYIKYNELRTRLTQLQEDESKAAAEEDYLKFVLKELQDLRPSPGLESDLAEKRSLLVNREKLIEAVTAASSAIADNNVEKSLQIAQNILIKNADLNPKFSDIAKMLDSASIEISEALSQMDNIAGGIEDNADSLEEIEERLFGLRAAARKHNVAVDDLQSYADTIAAKLDLLANKEAHIEALQKELSEAKKLYVEAAQKLSDARKKAAEKLEKVLTKELAPLKMENSRLQVSIEDLNEASWSEDGFNRVAFLVSTNPGSPFAPLAKIASGGELSRFMLALKVVLSDVKSVPTMIFDEVDTGIGGAVADAVGARLAALGKKLQVFAITHQPQVAAKGGLHLKVQKTQSKAGTTTNVTVLSETERTEELARMLAGKEITEEARAAAVRLLNLEAA